MPETETVSAEMKPDGVLEIKKEPSGPVVSINTDGTVTVHRGPFDEAGKLFWEAVNISGRTYSQRIDEMSQIIQTLGNDPYRDAVMDPYDVFHEIPRSSKKHITFMDVRTVLNAVVAVAKKRIQ